MQTYTMTKKLYFNNVQKNYLIKQMEHMQLLFNYGKKWIELDTQDVTYMKLYKYIKRKGKNVQSITDIDCQMICKQLLSTQYKTFRFNDLLANYVWHQIDFFHCMKVRYGWQKRMFQKPWVLIRTEFFIRNRQVFIRLIYIKT